MWIEDMRLVFQIINHFMSLIEKYQLLDYNTEFQN